MGMGIQEVSKRIAAGFADIERRAAAVPDTSKILTTSGISRTDPGETSDSDALGFIPIFRAAQLLATAAGQLPIEQHRGQKVIGGKSASSLLTRPDYDQSRTEWVQEAVLSLAFDGNLFLKVTRNNRGEVVRLQVLPPREVTITQDPKNGRKTYWHRGTSLKSEEILHQKFLPFPGAVRGLGPIQAARYEISGATELRDYAGNWFRDSKQPSGLLTGASIENGEQAKALQEYWNKTVNDVNNPANIRVLGGDLQYKPLFLSPEDAQWLEVRKFTVTDFARLLGIPSALMLVSLDGNSLTYSNVEQEWVAFVRFTLVEYLRKIEEVLSEALPIGSKARFNIEGLLRTDTRSRYDTYSIGLNAGFLTINEVRELEGLAPIKVKDELSA